MRIEYSFAGYGCGLQGGIVTYLTGKYTERERPLCSKSLFPWSVHVSAALSGFQTSGVKFTPAPHIEIHVREQKHATFRVKGRRIRAQGCIFQEDRRTLRCSVEQHCLGAQRAFT